MVEEDEELLDVETAIERLNAALALQHRSVLQCDECGCVSDELGRSWVAFTGEDPDGVEPTSVAIMCPVCAAHEFDWRPEAATDYV